MKKYKDIDKKKTGMLFSGIKLKTQTKVYKPMNTPNIFL